MESCRKESSPDFSEEEISEIENWIELKYEDALRKMNIANLPDSIGYGDDIEILGIDDQKLFLNIDEININPSAGDKEYIDIIKIIIDCGHF